MRGRGRELAGAASAIRAARLANVASATCGRVRIVRQHKKIQCIHVEVFASFLMCGF